MSDIPPWTAADAAIQPDGFLLLLGTDWELLGVSENITDHLAVPAGELIGQPLSELFAERAVHALRNRLALRRDPQSIARSYACGLAGERGPRFDIAMHGGDDWLIVEGQPSPVDERGDTVETVRAMIAALGRHKGLGALLADAARQLRALTGYDRVLICRRRADGSHDVMAESVRTSAPVAAPCDLVADLPSSVRVIRDSEAPPVTVRASGSPDLTHATLRAPSLDERRRLAAAGSRALLTLPLDCGGLPWGVIACHHPQPRRPGFERLAAIDLFVQMLGLLVEISHLRSGSSDARTNRAAG